LIIANIDKSTWNKKCFLEKVRLEKKNTRVTSVFRGFLTSSELDSDANIAHKKDQIPLVFPHN